MAKLLKDENPESRRGQPRKNYIKSLQAMTEKHYTMLERACVEAYLTRSYRVTLSLSYLTQLPADFPKSLEPRKQEGVVDVITVSARALLKWLNKHNYSTITAEIIRQSVVDFSIKTKGILNDPTYP